MIGQATMQSQVYTDLNRLQSLKNAAKDNSPEAVRDVARQFESLFINQLLRSMRESNAALNEDSLFNSNETKMYQDMLDQQMGIEIAQSGGLGLADVLVRQLLPQQSTETAMGVEDYQARSGNLLPTAWPSVAPTPSAELQQDAIAWEAVLQRLERQGAIPSVAESSQKSQFSDPEDFIRSLYPSAKQVADRLGVDERFLLAQAALETGWGKHLIKDDNGRNSYNLFGIKADPSWDGAKAATTTLEYRGGVPVKERAYFRSYNSYTESFSDYISFLQQNGRYSKALSKTADGAGFVKALQQAGYATDPRYASKIIQIAEGERMQQALASLKL